MENMEKRWFSVLAKIFNYIHRGREICWAGPVNFSGDELSPSAENVQKTLPMKNNAGF
jgi:hypothetical protein